MRGLIWFLFHSSPEAKMKDLFMELHYRMEGMKARKKWLQELNKNIPPKYKL